MTPPSKGVLSLMVEVDMLDSGTDTVDSSVEVVEEVSKLRTGSVLRSRFFKQNVSPTLTGILTVVESFLNLLVE